MKRLRRTSSTNAPGFALKPHTLFRWSDRRGNELATLETKSVKILDRAAVSFVWRLSGSERLSKLERAIKESAGVGKFNSNKAAQV